MQFNIISPLCLMMRCPFCAFTLFNYPQMFSFPLETGGRPSLSWGNVQKIGLLKGQTKKAGSSQDVHRSQKQTNVVVYYVRIPLLVCFYTMPDRMLTSNFRFFDSKRFSKSNFSTYS